MADDTLRIRVDADTSKAQQELRDLEDTAERVDLTPDTRSIGDLQREFGNAAGSLDDMAASAAGLPGPLGTAAGMLTGPAGIAAGAVAGAAGLMAMANSAADAALEAASLQAAVGGTVEESSRLLNATKSVGLNYNDLLELISESNRAIGANAEEARKLGVNLSGTPIERFQQLVDAVFAIEDPLERAAASSKFFGEEGSKQLPRLIGMYGSLGAAIDAVPEAAVVSERDVRNAQEFSKSMAELKAQAGALAHELGRLAIPVVTTGLKAVNDGAKDAAGSFNTFKTSLGGLLSGDWDRFVSGKDDVAELAVSAEDLATTFTGQLSGAFDQVASSGSDLVTLYNDLKTATDEARLANEDLRGELFTSADTALEAGRSWSDLNDNLADYRSTTEHTREDNEKLEDSVRNYADAQVAAAGTTRDTTEGAKKYKDALQVAAALLGDSMTPELQTFIDTALAVPDTAVTDVSAQLDPTEFNEADRRADELDRRTVTVKVAADVSQFVAAAQRAVSNLLGGATGRSQQSTAARYVWRNGRYVEA